MKQREVTHVTTREETPVFLHAGKEQLFGVLTSPLPEQAVGTAAILLPPGGRGWTSIHRNRFSVHLSRQLADDGFHAMRLDYRGVGDSTGPLPGLRLDRPHTEAVTGAVAWLRGHGIGRFVLVGSCFGARTQLAAAPEIQGLRGLVLISLPLREAGRANLSAPARMLRRVKSKLPRFARLVASRWRATRGGRHPGGGGNRGPLETPLVTKPLGRVVSSGTPVLFLYGSPDSDWEDFERARTGELGDITRQSSDSVEVVTLPGPVHNLPTVGMQEAALREVRAWFGRRRDDLTRLEG